MEDTIIIRIDKADKDKLKIKSTQHAMSVSAFIRFIIKKVIEGKITI